MERDFEIHCDVKSKEFCVSIIRAIYVQYGPQQKQQIDITGMDEHKPSCHFACV